MNKTLSNLQTLYFTFHEGIIDLDKARSALKTIPVVNAIDPLSDVDRQKLTKAMDAIVTARNILSDLHFFCYGAIRKELQSNDEFVERVLGDLCIDNTNY